MERLYLMRFPFFDCYCYLFYHYLFCSKLYFVCILFCSPHLLLLLYWLVNLPSVVHSGVTVVELLDMLINVSWGWALRTLLPQTTNFHLQATRKTYLVARPGNLLFEISLRDENSLTIICLPFLICCCVVCNSSSLPLFFTLIFLVFFTLFALCVCACLCCV